MNGDELIERNESDTFLKKWVQYERLLCNSLAPRTPTNQTKLMAPTFAQYYHMWLPVNNNSQVGSPLQIWKSFNSICRLALHGIRSKIYPTFGVKRRSVASLVICNGFYIIKRGVIAIHQSFPSALFPSPSPRSCPKTYKNQNHLLFSPSPLPKTSALGLAERNIILEQTNKRTGRGGRQNKPPPPFLYVLYKYIYYIYILYYS